MRIDTKIVWAIPFAVSLTLVPQAAAQEGSGEAPSISCGESPYCDAGIWGLNRNGYALIVSIDQPKTYQVCMARQAVSSVTYFNTFVHVDGRRIEFQIPGINQAILNTGGCVIVRGTKIELTSSEGVPVSRIQGTYRLIESQSNFRFRQNWTAKGNINPGLGPASPIYLGMPLEVARVCFIDEPSMVDQTWRFLRGLSVNGSIVRRSIASENAVFAKNTCIDISGTNIFAWREHDPRVDDARIGGSFIF